MKKFSIIVPCFRDGKKLARCISSIKDQDYLEKEIIVVLDGKDSTASEVLKANPDVKVAYTPKEKSGAPVARNIGAGIAQGDYLMFLDADTKLHPGSLTTFSEAFDDHPDCGFVYGGYKITGGLAYGSEEFDPYMLYINNYIDGNFPMRREVFEYWDKNLKSLQDWEFWIRTVQKGIKGHFIKGEYFFTKMAPGAGSISHDSHTHWLERRKTVQDLRQLPQRDIVMTSFAAVHHAKRCAKLLDYDYASPDMLMAKPHKYKAIYIVGWFPENSLQNVNLWMDMTKNPPTRKKEVKGIIHWIGSDVMHLRRMNCSFEAMQRIVKMFNDNFICYCQSESNANELKDLGVKAKYLPLPVEIQEASCSHPEKFTVAIYDHGTNNIYCEPLMIDIIKAMPDIDFLYFGDEKKKSLKIGDLDNIRFVGHVPMDKIYAQSSMLLRITLHDGFPVSPIEFLQAGKAVVCNQGLDYCENIKTDFTEKGVIQMRKDIMKAIRFIKRDYLDDDFFNMARAHYKRVLNPMRLRKDIDKQI